MELRNADFSLSDDQETLRSTFASLFERECPIERVREVESTGFDERLWKQLIDTGATTMGVPVDRGGDGAGLVELALVVEQAGYRLAPVPLVSVMVATRLLAACGAPIDATRSVVIALHPGMSGERQLVPGGAVADAVVGLVDDALVLTSRDEPVPTPRNLAADQLAWWDLADPAATRSELSAGSSARALFDAACCEWRLLTASVLTGVAQGALDLAVQYAKDREAFGVPIGAFQAIAHPLVDVAVAIEGARHLVAKAAWLADHEPEVAPAIVEMAFLHAARTAQLATTTGVHTQGGFGFTLESDMQLYFRRAKGWALVGGDPHRQLGRIADLMWGEAEH